MIARALIILVLTVFVSTAARADVGAAKAAGHACEQANGYLQASAGAPENVKSLVNSVNEKRKKHYAGIAANNGVEVNQVARLTAEKLIKQEPQFACK